MKEYTLQNILFYGLNDVFVTKADAQAKIEAAIAEKDKQIAELQSENFRLDLRCQQATQLYMMHRDKKQVELRQEIKQQAEEIKRLKELLKAALPKLPCDTQDDSLLISAIGEATKEATDGGK